MEEDISKLEERVRIGFERIQDAMTHGITVDQWEKAWIDLLREYERLMNGIE